MFTSLAVSVIAPWRVLNDVTALVVRAFATNAVVAILVELSLAICVGAVGVPVKAAAAGLTGVKPSALVTVLDAKTEATALVVRTDATSLEVKVTTPPRPLKLITSAELSCPLIRCHFEPVKNT